MAPFLCKISATRTMLFSKTPSVFGLVTIKAATSLVTSCSSVDRSTPPVSLDLMFSTA